MRSIYPIFSFFLLLFCLGNLIFYSIPIFVLTGLALYIVFQAQNTYKYYI